MGQCCMERPWEDRKQLRILIFGGGPVSIEFKLAIGFSVLFSFSLLTQDAEAQRFRFRYRNHSQPVRSVPPNCSNFRSVAPAQTMVAYPYLSRRAPQPSYQYTIRPVRPIFTDPMPTVPSAKPGDAVEPAINHAAPPTRMLNPVVPTEKVQPVTQTTPTDQPVAAQPTTAAQISKSR